jgi:Flp pilus assembly CpaF family ATPase
LASCIPPSERLVTIEQALELGLDKLHKRHPNCIALEAREANIEGAGEIGMSRLVRRSLRMNADRVIVGEVLGDEVIPMLNAMSQGRSGSMCTIHSNSSAGVFRRIASYAAQSPERLGLEATNILIAGSIDFVVHIDATHELFAQPFDQSAEEGYGISTGFSMEGEEYFPNLKLYRRVTSIREVIDAEGNQVVSNEIWRPSADGVAVRSVALQHRTQVDLEEFGYRDQSSFATSGSWE